MRFKSAMMKAGRTISRAYKRGNARIARTIRKPANLAAQKIGRVLGNAYANLHVRPKFTDSADTFALKKQLHEQLSSSARNAVTGKLQRFNTRVSHKVVKSLPIVATGATIYSVKKRRREVD